MWGAIFDGANAAAYSHEEERLRKHPAFLCPPAAPKCAVTLHAQMCPVSWQMAVCPGVWIMREHNEARVGRRTIMRRFCEFLLSLCTSETASVAA